MTEVTKYRLVSIDAWRDFDGGWTWNQWYNVEDGVYLGNDITARRLLKFMRQSGWLTHASKGRVRIDWHNEMCEPFIEILDKNTGEPLLAFTTLHGSE